MRLRFMIVVLMAFMHSSFHPFYLGVTNIKYKQEEKTVQVTLKLFVNDLEEALGAFHGKKVDILNTGDKTKISNDIRLYVNKHFLLTANGGIQEMKWIGFEIESEAVWMYFEYEGIQTLKHLGVENDLLYEKFSKQEHIIQLEAGKTKVSTKITCPEKSASFEL